ncbi:hypothetical protein RJ55_02922 [Drechmeria coniospora]|nr:hypothetical protein RJ55_02922 [Drechmeria coniospora]
MIINKSIVPAVIPSSASDWPLEHPRRRRQASSNANAVVIGSPRRWVYASVSRRTVHVCTHRRSLRRATRAVYTVSRRAPCPTDPGESPAHDACTAPRRVRAPACASIHRHVPRGRRRRRCSAPSALHGSTLGRDWPMTRQDEQGPRHEYSTILAAT